MTPLKVAIIAVSALLALAWIPVGLHFWRAWKRRGSPLSLAICALIGYPIFTNASTYIFLTGEEAVTVQVMIGANLLLFLNFLLCFRWQKKTFPDARTRATGFTDPPDFWKMKSDPTTKSDG
jgi:hypothetical protein